MVTDLSWVDSETLARHLAGYPRGVRDRGEWLFKNAHVSKLLFQQSNTVSSEVADQVPFVATVTYNQAEEEWENACDCASSTNCAHTYALGKALLAEKTQSEVQRLSASAVSAPPMSATHPQGTALEQAARLAVGRELTRREAACVTEIQRLYKKYGRSKTMPAWELNVLGVPFRAFNSFTVSLAPFPISSDLEFWDSLARHFRKTDVNVADCLDKIPPLPEMEENYKRWHLEKRLREWRDQLEDLAGKTVAIESLNRPTIALHLRVHGVSASLYENTVDDSGVAGAAKRTDIDILDDEVTAGAVRFAEGHEQLYLIFKERSRGGEEDLRLGMREDAELLSTILRSTGLRKLVTDGVGKPMVFHSEALRWNMEPPTEPDGNYTLRLCDPNGKMLAREPLPLPGHPPLYLTERGVFEGPKCPPDLLSTAAPNPIPARVVESSSGLHLFRALGLPIPEKIQSRVRVKPLEVTIACKLEPIYPGSATELCCFDVTASEPGGRNKMTWTGTGWESQSRRTSNFKWLIDEKPDDEIVTPDRTNMDRIPPLLAPLALAPDPRVSGLSMKVRKDFPTVFADWLKRVPAEITVLLEGDLKCFAGGNVVGTVNLDVAESSQDWFDLKVAIEVTDLALTKEEIKLLLNAKGGFVRLKNKGWKRLEFDISPEEDQQLAALGLSPREFSAEPQRLHVLQLADAAARRFLDEDQVEKIQRRAGEIKARVTPPIPGAIRAELRPYQTEGFHFLAYLASNRFGGILADDMGLGKTLQTLSWLTWLRSEAASTGKEAKPSLVVAPKSVMENWQKETSKFSPGIRVRTWRASELVDLGTNLDQADLHIINYNQLRLAGEGIGGISWQAVILDEGQYIKNPNSQTAQIARVLKSEHRLVLTGTPIENRLMDLWSLMAFAMPGMLGPRQQFSRHYDAPGDPLARKRLAARVRPFLLRRTKSQVAKDLPDRVEEELYCELEGEQKTLYRAELKRAQSVLLGIKSQKELAKQTFHVLTSILRLRQICCSPRLLDPGSKAPNAKMEALMDQLEPLMQEGHKVLVFSQFVEMLRMVQDEVQSRQWTFFFLAGDTENRGELVDQFQDHKGSAVFLISLKAGGFGLNLTAASYVVLYDPWWNPAVENQAIDRTHRIGQRNTVNAYRLIVKGSIEEKIRELQKAKKNLVEDVLGEEKFSSSLTMDDLHYLFAD